MATRRALRPLMDRVLVERIAPATKSVGGVLLPESMTTKTVRARATRRRAKDGWMDGWMERWMDGRESEG